MKAIVTTYLLSICTLAWPTLILPIRAMSYSDGDGNARKAFSYQEQSVHLLRPRVADGSSPAHSTADRLGPSLGGVRFAALDSYGKWDAYF